MDNETPVAVGGIEGSRGGGAAGPPGGSTISPSRFRITPRHHGYLIYGLMALGSLSLGTWYYVRIFLCWRDAFYTSPGGHIVCLAHRGTYVTSILGGIVFLSLLIELSLIGHELEGGTGRHGIRTAIRGYRSLERRDFIHVTVATLWSLAILLFILWFKVLSDWWIK